MGIQHTLVTSYPGKALWTIFAIALNAFRLPFWLFYFIPSFLRQNTSWSYRQAVRVRIVRAFLYNAAVVEMKTPLSLKQGKEKERFVVIDPAPASNYVGVTRKDSEITPARIGGTWYPAEPKASEAGFVVLHFHGGAFAIGDGRTEDAGFAAATMIEHSDATHVFCPQYRLSSNAGGRFPAQLQDAITALAYLARKGIDFKKIIVSGDSAGGNLVLSLLRYLVDNGSQTGLGDPAAAWCWSPWVNPSDSIRLGVNAIERNPNFPTDYLTGEFGLWGASGLLPASKSGLTISDPYISILGNAFATKVPVWIQAGQCEVLLHDDSTMAKQFQAIQGNKCELHIEPNAVHDIILTGKIMSFEKEAIQATQQANKFLKKHAA